MVQSRRCPGVVLIRITLGWFECLTTHLHLATTSLSSIVDLLNWVPREYNNYAPIWPLCELLYYCREKFFQHDTMPRRLHSVNFYFNEMCVCLHLMFFLLLCFWSYNIILCSQLSKQQHELSNVNNIFIKKKLEYTIKAVLNYMSQKKN